MSRVPGAAAAALVTITITLAAAAISIGGCASAPKAGEPSPEAEAASALEGTRADEVARYYGTVTYRYPDGRTAISRTLAERVVDGARGTITERYWRPASAGTDAKPVPVTMRYDRRPNQDEVAVFALSETPSGGEGTARMLGPEWNWGSWTFRERLPDASWVEGDVTISPSEWRVARRAFRSLAAMRGKRPFLRIEEELRAIPEKRFNELREQLESGRWWL